MGEELGGLAFLICKKVWPYNIVLWPNNFDWWPNNLDWWPNNFDWWPNNFTQCHKMIYKPSYSWGQG